MIATVALLQSTLLSGAGFLHAFPTREACFAELAASLGAERVVQVRQVHGARVALVEDGPAEADAIVARAPTEPGEGRVAVGVRVADCVPVLVADPDTGNVAAIHAGWRGVVAGVIGEAVKMLGGRALVAAIGPCIEACCFEVGPDVITQLGLALCRGSEIGQVQQPGSLRSLGILVREVGDKAFVDLRAAVRAQLYAAGFDPARVDDVRGCTKHDLRFHSFRREGANSGRMLASIATPPARREPPLATQPPASYAPRTP